MTTTPSTATGIEIVRDAWVASDIKGLHYRLEGDHVNAILSVGAEFFAISEQYDSDSNEIDGYSWAWGEGTDDGDDYFGLDGGATEAEARQAVAEWLARFAR